MRRIALLTAIPFIMVVPLAGETQPTERVRVVGMMVGRPEAARAFEEGLREFGWVEGKTVRFERHVGTDYQKLTGFAAVLMRIPADVILRR